MTLHRRMRVRPKLGRYRKASFAAIASKKARTKRSVDRRARLAALKIKIKLAGRKRAAEFQEKLIENSAAALARAMEPALKLVRQLLTEGSSLAEIERRLPGLLADMNSSKSKEVVARTLIISKLQGLATAREEA